MKDDLIERLRAQAVKLSALQRDMAEAKSLRQSGNTKGRTDLYMWPTPEQTIEGRALAHIEALTAKLERVREALERIDTGKDIGGADAEVQCSNIARQALKEIDSD